MSSNRLLCWSGLCLALLFAAASAGGETGKVPDGLHIPPGRQVSFNTSLNDGSGQRWYLQRYLSVYQGINYIYSGGVYCQVSGSNVDGGGRGWMNAAGDEIEIGPWNRNNCRIYRRCKVYRDRGLARWLDIFVNTTSSKQTVPVRIYTNTNGSVSRVTSSSGAGSFTQKDWAFITEHQGRACLLHVVCGAKSKLRPSVRASGNTIYVNYSVTVPAGGVAVLCYFESQANGADELKKRMAQFGGRSLLSDLPLAVRRLIVNFRSRGMMDEIELDRSGTADVVLLKNGDSISGTITNKEFVIEPFYGSLTLPAEKVIGFATVTGQDAGVCAVLAGRQVVTGKLQDAVVKLALPTGGNLDIPFSRLKQCSYRVSKEKPEESPAASPLILLRTGDRLAFDAADLACTFRTRHGSVELNGKDLLQIRLDHEEHGVHRAEFLNGSTLAGLLEPERIVLPLKLGRKLDISRDMVLAVRFAEEGKEGSALTRAILNNDDELFGRLEDKTFAVTTDFGTVNVKPDNILKMSFSAEDPGRVAIKMWDGSTIRGRIRQETLRFALQPGPVLNLHVALVGAIERSDALPPDEIVKRVEKYVAMLSAASYADREEAQEALIRMGRTIAPLLKKHIKDTDPEVRQRITVILEKLGVNVSDADNIRRPPFDGAAPWGGRLIIRGG